MSSQANRQEQLEYLLADRNRFGKVVGYLGQTGGGKTYLMRLCIHATAAKYPGIKWFIWDSGDEGAQFLFGKFDGKGKKRRFIHGKHSLPYGQCRVYTKPSELASLPSDLCNPRYRYYIWNGGDFVFRDHLAIPAMSLGGVVLCCDELDLHIPKNGELEAPLDRLFQKGRHVRGTHGDSVSVLWACQRVQQINLNAVSAMRTAYLLCTPSANDRKVFSGYVGEYDEQQLATMEPGVDPWFLRFDKQKPYVGANPYIIDGLTEYEGPVTQPKKREKKNGKGKKRG